MSKSRSEQRFEVGDHISLSQGQTALIKFIGKTHLGAGIWYGIEYVDGTLGKHNGTFQNTFYFDGCFRRCDFIRGKVIRSRVKESEAKAIIVLHSKSNRKPMTKHDKLVSRRISMPAQLPSLQGNKNNCQIGPGGCIMQKKNDDHRRTQSQQAMDVGFGTKAQKDLILFQSRNKQVKLDQEFQRKKHTMHLIEEKNTDDDCYKNNRSRPSKVQPRPHLFGESKKMKKRKNIIVSKNDFGRDCDNDEDVKIENDNTIVQPQSSCFFPRDENKIDFLPIGKFNEFAMLKRDVLNIQPSCVQSPRLKEYAFELEGFDGHPEVDEEEEEEEIISAGSSLCAANEDDEEEVFVPPSIVVSPVTPSLSLTNDTMDECKILDETKKNVQNRKRSITLEPGQIGVTEAVNYAEDCVLAEVATPSIKDQDSRGVTPKSVKMLTPRKQAKSFESIHKHGVWSSLADVIRMLTNPKQPFPTSNILADAIFLTLPYFSNSMEMLKCLENQFFGISENSKMSNKDMIDWRIQANCVKLIGKWVSGYYLEDFYKNSELLSKFEEFCERIVSTYTKNDECKKDNYVKMDDVIRDKRIAFSEEIRDTLTIAIKGFYKTNCLKKNKKQFQKQSNLKCEKNCNKKERISSSPRNDVSLSISISHKNIQKNNSLFLEYNAMEIADQLTLIDEELFHNIRKRECIQNNWKTEKLKQKNAPNIREILAHVNRLDAFVKWSVLSQQKEKTRGKVIDRVIRICRTLMTTHHNFHTMFCLFDSLSSTPVFRLRKSWKHISQTSSKTWHQIKELLNMSNSYLILRKTQSKAPFPKIPYIGILTSDLIGLDQIPKIKSDTGINTQCIEKIYSIVDTELAFQKHSFSSSHVNVRKNEFLRDLLMQQIQSIYKITGSVEDYFYHCSIAIEKNKQ